MKAQSIIKILMGIVCIALFTSCKARKVNTSIAKSNTEVSTQTFEQSHVIKVDTGSKQTNSAITFQSNEHEQTTIYPQAGNTFTFANGTYNGTADSVKLNRRTQTQSHTTQQQQERYGKAVDSVANKQVKAVVKQQANTKNKESESDLSTGHIIAWLVTLAVLAFLIYKYLKG